MVFDHLQITRYIDKILDATPALVKQVAIQHLQKSLALEKRFAEYITTITKGRERKKIRIVIE
jgi:hypothetical protein